MACRVTITGREGGSFAPAMAFWLRTASDKTLLKQAEAVEIRSSPD
jgi:hypothetical protein